MIFDDFVELMDNEDFKDFGDFSKVSKKRSPYRDLHALMLLSELLPGTGKVLGGSDHETVYLSFDVHELVPLLTPEIVYELKHCGVLYDEDNEALMMFV